ncbi:MAG: hypothetical protein ACI8W8_000255 [Rhodothermales bacterium]
MLSLHPLAQFLAVAPRSYASLNLRLAQMPVVVAILCFLSYNPDCESYPHHSACPRLERMLPDARRASNGVHHLPVCLLISGYGRFLQLLL